MDRHNQLHTRWRVDLPKSLHYAELVGRLGVRRRPPPIVGTALGVVSFLSCGFAVIATASLLALHIQ